MEVKLLTYTPNPDKIVAVAARLCYSKLKPSELYENLTDEEINLLINIVVSNKHYSTLEHAVFTFSIEGVSRACTHQLVRHRIASYNQQSQRYVAFDETLDYYIPDEIEASYDEDVVELYHQAMTTCKDIYLDLIDRGISAEDARYVLPNAANSNIIVTMNARELLHFFSLRCCNRAQDEIRHLAWHMLQLAKDVAPKLFRYAGPPCSVDRCAEGRMSCKHPYPKIEEEL